MRLKTEGNNIILQVISSDFELMDESKTNVRVRWNLDRTRFNFVLDGTETLVNGFLSDGYGYTDLVNGDDSDEPFLNLDALKTYLRFNTGNFSTASGGSGAFVQSDNYSSLQSGVSIGHLAYVKDSEGTKWLPGVVGGTYYPAGWYIWTGASWVSDRNDIAETLDGYENWNTAYTHSQSVHVHQNETIVVGNHGEELIDEVVNVCYGTSSTPPAAGTVTEGTIYMQYT